MNSSDVMLPLTFHQNKIPMKGNARPLHKHLVLHLQLVIFQRVDTLK